LDAEVADTMNEVVARLSTADEHPQSSTEEQEEAPPAAEVEHSEFWQAIGDEWQSALSVLRAALKPQTLQQLFLERGGANTDSR
jgi:hypothetical protein